MALSEAAIAAISQAASTVGSAATGFGGSYTSAKKAYKYGKKMFNLQNARQDYLLENENLIKKNALQKAGYSTADPNGTGVVTPSVGSVPTPHVDNPLGATAQGLAAMNPLMMAQIANLNADTKNKGSENEILKLDLEKYKATLNEQIETIKSQYYNITKENRKLDTEIDNIAEVTRGLNIDNNFKEDTFNQRKDELFNRLSLLVKENKIKDVEAVLAENGILLGANELQTLVAVAEYGKTAHLTQAIGDIVKEFGKTLPGVIKDIFVTLWHAITD